MTNIDRLVVIFGGKTKSLADVCGINPAMVTRWNKPLEWKHGRHRGNGGRLPPKYNARVLEAAGALARDMGGDDGVAVVLAVNECLDPAICPTCGRPLDDGHVV